MPQRQCVVNQVECRVNEAKLRVRSVTIEPLQLAILAILLNFEEKASRRAPGAILCGQIWQPWHFYAARVTKTDVLHQEGAHYQTAGRQLVVLNSVFAFHSVLLSPEPGKTTNVYHVPHDSTEAVAIIVLQGKLICAGDDLVGQRRALDTLFFKFCCIIEQLLSARLDARIKGRGLAMNTIVLVHLPQITLDGANLDVKGLGVRGLDRVATEEPSSIGKDNTFYFEREVIVGPPVTLDEV